MSLKAHDTIILAKALSAYNWNIRHIHTSIIPRVYISREGVCGLTAYTNVKHTVLSNKLTSPGVNVYSRKTGKIRFQYSLLLDDQNSKQSLPCLFSKGLKQTLIFVSA